MWSSSGGTSSEADQAIAVCRGGLSEGCFAVISSPPPLEEVAASEEGLLPFPLMLSAMRDFSAASFPGSNVANILQT